MPKEYKTTVDKDCKKMVQAYIRVYRLLTNAHDATRDGAFKQVLKYLSDDVIPDEIEFWDGEEGLEEYAGEVSRHKRLKD